MATKMDSLKDKKVFTAPMLALVGYLVAEYAKISFLGPLQLALLVQVYFVIIFLRSKGEIDGIIKDKFFKYYFILILIMIFHVFFSRNNYWSFMQFRLLLTYLILNLAFCLFLNTEKKIYSFIFIYLFIILLAGLDRIFGFGFIGCSGVLGDENDFALAMNVVIPISFFLGLSFHGIKRYYFWFSMIIFVIGNVVCGSRGGFIGLASVSIISVFFLKSKIKGFIILILLFGLFWSLIPSSFKNEISTISNETQQEIGTTGYGRMQVWKLAWNVFKDYPLIGVGQGNIPFYLQEYMDLDDPDSYWIDKPGQGGRQTHSVYFTILPELGLSGCLLFILIIKQNLQKAKFIIKVENNKNKFLGNLSIGLIVGMFGYLTSGIFLSAFYYPQFWNISALILTIYRLENVKEFNPVFFRNRGMVVNSSRTPL